MGLSSGEMKEKLKLRMKTVLKKQGELQKEVFQISTSILKPFIMPTQHINNLPPPATKMLSIFWELVHTEGSILHAKESLKSIPEVNSEEERDYYEGEGGSVDSMSTYEVNENEWPQVSRSFSLEDAAARFGSQVQSCNGRTRA